MYYTIVVSIFGSREAMETRALFYLFATYAVWCHVHWGYSINIANTDI